jgi:SSS family transporter
VPVLDSPLVLWIAACYLLVCIAIGVWSARRTRTAADFFVAGKRLGLFVTVMAMNASVMSGLGFVGGPGIVYATGMTSLWLVAAFVGGPLALLLVGKRLRLAAEVREIYTLPDLIAARYGGRAPRAAMAAALLLGVVGYTGTQVLALGMVMTAVFGLELPAAMAIGLAVLAFYSVAGGMIAAVYTDLFQGLLMTAAAFAIAYYALDSGGGMAEITSTLWAMDADFAGPFGSMGPAAALSWYVLGAVGVAGQPHMITKYLMLGDIAKLKWSAAVGVITYAPMTLVWLTVGVAMRALVETGVEAPLTSPDMATPVFLLRHTPPLVAGVALAGLLGAIMSTADSFLNLGAGAVVRDLAIAWRGRPLERELLWGRVATGATLAVSAAFALYMESLTALLGTFAAGTFAAAIVPSVAIGMNWKRATAGACVASIAVSLGINLTVELLNRNGVHLLPDGLFAGTLSLLVSIVVFVAVSFASGDEGERNLPADIAAVMDV